MFVDELQSGQNVLLLWNSSSNPEKVKTTVEELKKKIGDSGSVQVEHTERLALSDHTTTFDAAILGLVSPDVHSQDLLASVAKSLRPSGTVCLHEVVVSQENGSNIRTAEKVESALKLAGFVSISKTSSLSLTSEDLQSLKDKFKSENIVGVVEVKGSKPSYEVGSSSQLQLPWAKKAQEPSKAASSVWTLSANDMTDEGVEVIDSDDLLNEDDLKKPDPSSLRVQCGDGSAKKKACKNCTCGLAEEQEGDKKPKRSSNVTSACGNCYLGDAFRCSSCPYLGMPAYKPGEKIQLSNRQLNADK